MSILSSISRFVSGREPDDAKEKYGNLSAAVQQWLNSRERSEMLRADRYYRGFQDIYDKKRKVIGPDGKLMVVENLPNNRIVNNQYRKAVDQKTNYALGKPFTIAAANDEYLSCLTEIFDKEAFRQFRLLGQYSINGGIAWLYPYYNGDGKLKFKVFPSYEVCPVWTDGSHTELTCAIRVYSDAVIGNDPKDVSFVEVYTKDGVDRYRFNGKVVRPVETEQHANYITLGEEGYNWGELPIIPFKYNACEIPLIRDTKNAQDAINDLISTFMDNMQEDPRNALLVLKNYDGENLADFRVNAATYGAVKVQTVDGVNGDVDVLNTNTDSANYQLGLMQLKRDFIENARGFDAKEERMDGDPNQMNIESMYTDIDLDVNGMETEFQAGFEKLKYFIDRYLIGAGRGDFTGEHVEFIFNRDIFINEDAIIENCVKSVGIISNKTIVAKHPWVADLQHELGLIEEQENAELRSMEDMNAFNTGQSGEKNTKSGVLNDD